jgi:hypothetical protein
MDDTTDLLMNIDFADDSVAYEQCIDPNIHDEDHDYSESLLSEQYSGDSYYHLPPPPPVDMSRVGERSNARSDRVYEVERMQTRTQNKKRKRKGRGPTRAHIPPSRQLRMLNTKQTGSVPLAKLQSPHGQSLASAEIAVRSNIALVSISDSKSKNAMLIDSMQRAAGKLTRTPAFLNKKTKLPYPETWEFECWWDSHTFTGKPVGCPVRHIHKTKTFYLAGFFCSYNCMRAWADLNVKSRFIGLWIMRMIAFDMKNGGFKLDYSKFTVEAAPHYSCLKRKGGDKSIEDFRNQHCAQTRLSSIPQWLNIIPMGFNIFEYPRDNEKLFTSVRPKRYKIGATNKQTDDEAAKSFQKGVNKSINKIIYEQKNRQKSKYKKHKPSATAIAASQAFKMSRGTPRRQRSIKNLMGIT